MRALAWRCVCIGCLLVAAVVTLWARPLQPGLDLQGGIEVILQVDVEEGLRREAAASVERGEERSRDAAAVAAVRREWVEQARRTIERRVNALGVSEPVIAVQGERGDQLLVQLPGVTDVERAKTVIQSTGLLELALVEDGPTADRRGLRTDLDGSARTVESDGDDGAGFYLIRTVPVVGGTDIRSARPSIDEFNQPAVSFTLGGEAAARFERFTAEHIGRRLAIVIDDKVHSAPAIEGRIGGDGVIRGGFTPQEAQDLAVVLRSGALSAPLHYVAQHTIGATLGADAVRAGITASVAAAALVAAFMVVYYRMAGVNAVATMAFNLVLLLALMASIGSIVTLPGIAGLVLTIGIGVDSNVLIFERIKEELSGGAAVPLAVRAGFSRVFLTLLDTHVAALASAAFLFQFGTGAIRGFAVTLSLGLAVNLFTATFVSRTLFMAVTARRQPGPLSI